jgi:hypothetical protein
LSPAEKTIGRDGRVSLARQSEGSRLAVTRRPVAACDGQASVVLCADFKFARGVKQSDDGRKLEADISVFRLPFLPLPVAEKL